MSETLAESRFYWDFYELVENAIRVTGNFTVDCKGHQPTAELKVR